MTFSDLDSHVSYFEPSEIPYRGKNCTYDDDDDDDDDDDEWICRARHTRGIKKVRSLI